FALVGEAPDGNLDVALEDDTVGEEPRQPHLRRHRIRDQQKQTENQAHPLPSSSTQVHASGKASTSSTVIAMLTQPISASSSVQVLSVCASLSPPMRAKIQNPLSFIHEPTSEPLPMAVARYTGWNPRPSKSTIATSMADETIIAAVLDPCANLSSAVTTNPRNSTLMPAAAESPASPWMAGASSAARRAAPNAPPAQVISTITPPVMRASPTPSANPEKPGLRSRHHVSRATQVASSSAM